MRLPKAVSNWNISAVGSASVCGSMARTSSPARPWYASTARDAGQRGESRFEVTVAGFVSGDLPLNDSPTLRAACSRGLCRLATWHPPPREQQLANRRRLLCEQRGECDFDDV